VKQLKSGKAGEAQLNLKLKSEEKEKRGEPKQRAATSPLEESGEMEARD